MYIYLVIPKSWDTMWGQPIAFSSKQSANEYVQASKLIEPHLSFEIHQVYVRK